MLVPIEKIWKHFENKYKAVNVASLDARRTKELHSKGLLDAKVNPIFEAMRKLTAGKIRYTD
ncbi:MAG: DNA-directed RNA polymerase subunit omega [candidate division WOR-3 bacterium]|nr:MAG: DNA-directed RNA polymerase subunit omega [candidate division WOR-3 bacterium]